MNVTSYSLYISPLCFYFERSAPCGHVTCFRTIFPVAQVWKQLTFNLLVLPKTFPLGHRFFLSEPHFVYRGCDGLSLSLKQVIMSLWRLNKHQRVKNTHFEEEAASYDFNSWQVRRHFNNWVIVIMDICPFNCERSGTSLNILRKYVTEIAAGFSHSVLANVSRWFLSPIPSADSQPTVNQLANNISRHTALINWLL